MDELAESSEMKTEDGIVGQTDNIGKDILSVNDDSVIDLGDNEKVPVEQLQKATSFGHRKSYQFFGEVSFLLPFHKKEVKKVISYQPLGFLRAVGFEREQAEKILEDPIIFTNIYIVLKEARLWSPVLNHSQTTLLYEAVEKLTRGKRATEYIALATDAVINENISNYAELTAFIKMINRIEEGKLSWEHIIPLIAKKEMKNIPCMFLQYGVEKVFTDTLNLAMLLKEKDDKMMAAGDLEEIEDEEDEGEEVSEENTTKSTKSDDEESDENTAGNTVETMESVADIPLVTINAAKFRLLKKRRNMSEKEITKQCCIFANYYDHSVYYYLPLIAHMIARGYFTNYIQIEAVTDYLRPICGTRPVTLQEVLNVLRNVSTWKCNRFNKKIYCT